MRRKLQESWQSVLDSRGESTAVVDAVSGAECTFRQIDARANAWLAAHGRSQSPGGLWCLAVSDRVEWLAIFLATIKADAVAVPLEPDTPARIREHAQRLGASLLVDDAGVQALERGRSFEGSLLIKLTSGTTGEPKPLPFTETEMLADGSQIMASMSISAADRNYVVIPLGHSYGLGNLVIPFFAAGVPMVLGSSPFPQVIWEELHRYPCTVLPLVPPLVKALASVSPDRAEPTDLRLVISAGSALKPVVARRFHEQTGLRVHNFYGSSETGGICFDREGRAAETNGAVGTPMEGVSLSVDEEGSIRIRSRAICHALYPDGSVTLHDFGQLDDDGALRLTGRYADLVKIGGRRMSLAEVESALCVVDGVSDAYVSVREGRTGEARCVALFTGEIETEAVRRALGVQLADWKLPKVLRKTDRIAYTRRGKKDRTEMERVLDELITGRS